NNDISYLVYTLGVAALLNYQKIIQDWFNRSLSEYNFYIMPLGFDYNYCAFSLLDREKRSDIINQLFDSVVSAKNTLDETKGFYFTCEINVKVVSAKKADLQQTIQSDRENQGIAKVVRKVNLIDSYPLTYAQLLKKVKQELPNVKQTTFNNVLKKEIKGNPKYSAYNFRSKLQKKDYNETGKLPTGIPCIYNHDALRFLITKLKEI
ncbi:hypothetical protein J7L67_02380, partial [bacterium]|nr:hypothetical protein [bacterium]